MKKDRSTIYERLLVLAEQGYIQKAYDSTYRLPPRPAIYSLAPKGITYLRHANTGGKYSDSALQNMYKNRSASPALVENSISICALWVQLMRQYPGEFDIFTQSEMAQFEVIVRPLPSLYLVRRTFDKGDETDDNRPQVYILETQEAGSMTWLLRKRLQIHQALAEQYEDKFEKQYPTLLVICGNANTERRLQALVENGYFDFNVWSATQERIAGRNQRIWCEDWYEDEWVFRGL